MHEREITCFVFAYARQTQYPPVRVYRLSRARRGNADRTMQVVTPTATRRAMQPAAKLLTKR